MFSSAVRRPFQAAFAAGDAVTYLLRDEFTTNAAAPLTSPRPCEPGPGTLTLVDTGNLVSISGQRLQIAGLTVSYSDPRFYSVSSYPRTVGLAFIYTHQAVTGRRYGLGWGTTTSGMPNTHCIEMAGGILYPVPSYVDIGAVVTTGVDYRFALILRSSSAFALIKGGAYTEWTLIWVWSTSTSSPLYIGGCKSNVGGIEQVDNLKVLALPAPWTNDNGIATSVTTSPSNGQTTTSEANALIEVTWTPAAAETYELSVRRTDDDNRWIVRCDQAGSTIKLIERNAGVETERASAAQTWTNATAYRIVVIQDGNTIRTFVANVAKNTYASASFNNTATGVKSAGGATTANLITFPRTLSGAALATLQAV